jgi:hypothetical protein
LFTNGPAAIAQNTLTDGTVETNALTHPANPNSSVTLWGTGLGTAGTRDVLATVGSRPVPVTYAGHSAMPGLDQINLQIPDDPEIPEGCYVAVEVSVTLPSSGPSTTETSDRASISFARGAAQACAHPLNLTVGEMQTLDQGGTIPLLSLTMTSLDTPNPLATGTYLSPTRSDDAVASVVMLDAAGIASSSGAMLEAPGASLGCRASPISIFPERPFYEGLSAGSALSLTGPAGQA